jgi:hypothetical protein
LQQQQQQLRPCFSTAADCLTGQALLGPGLVGLLRPMHAQRVPAAAEGAGNVGSNPSRCSKANMHGHLKTRNKPHQPSRAYLRMLPMLLPPPPCQVTLSTSLQGGSIATYAGGMLMPLEPRCQACLNSHSARCSRAGEPTVCISSSHPNPPG